MSTKVEGRKEVEYEGGRKEGEYEGGRKERG